MERSEPMLEGKPVRMQLSQHGACMIHAPPKVVGVIVGNLIRNACAYTDAGQIDIQLRCGEVVIADSGHGIEAEELSRIFQPFYRASGAAPGGHGVGLNIVRRLCDRFGWEVKLESELGKGTTATVSFPDARPAPANGLAHDTA
jgi:signal transduction histidine kinase